MRYEVDEHEISVAQWSRIERDGTRRAIQDATCSPPDPSPVEQVSIIPEPDLEASGTDGDVSLLPLTSLTTIFTSPSRCQSFQVQHRQCTGRKSAEDRAPGFASVVC